MPNDLRLGIRLTADGKGFVGEVRVAKEQLGQFGNTTKKAAAENKRFNSTITKLQKQLGAYVAGYLSLKAAIGATRGIIRAADSYTELDNRLRLVTASESALTLVRGELLTVSQATRTELTANASLYSRIALASDNLGRSQSEVLRVTELLNKQVAIGGNNSTEAAAGLIQFAQGLASGRLQGDELRSVMENLLGVQQGLLVGFRKLRESGQIDFDVTRANIRELAADGVLSAELLLDAVLASGDDTEAKFKQIQITVAGALTQIGNSLTNAIGELNAGTGASVGLASGLSSISKAIDEANIERLVKVLGYADEAVIALALRFGGPLLVSLTVTAARSALAAVQLARMGGASRAAVTLSMLPVPSPLLMRFAVLSTRSLWRLGSLWAGYYGQWALA